MPPTAKAEPATEGAPGTEPRIGGQLQELSPRGLMWVLGLISGLALAKGLLRPLGRLLIGYRRAGELVLQDGELVLTESLFVLGRIRSTARTVVSLPHVAAVRLTKGPPALAMGGAIASLCLGTYVGAGFLFEGLTAAGFAPSLLGLGLLLIGLGIVLDAAWLNGLPGRPGLESQAVLRVEFASGRGLELTRLDAGGADALLGHLESTLEAS